MEDVNTNALADFRKTRLQIFNSFWSLGSYERQKDFVCSNVMEKKTKTYLDKNNQVIQKRRMVYGTYTFECEGQSHQACQKFFTATSNIDEGYISHTLANTVGADFKAMIRASVSHTTKQVKQNWHMYDSIWIHSQKLIHTMSERIQTDNISDGG